MRLSLFEASPPTISRASCSLLFREAMGDAGACRKGREVPGPHRVNRAINPGVDLTLEHVHEFLFLLLGMRPRTSLPGRQPQEIHANPSQPRGPADTPLMTGVLIAVGILVGRLRNRRGRNDERRSFSRIFHAVHLTQSNPECLPEAYKWGGPPCPPSMREPSAEFVASRMAAD